MLNASKTSALVAALVGSGTHSPRLPDDCSSAVILSRALDELAKAMFANLWTGQERNARLPPALPDAIQLTSAGSEAGATATDNRAAVWFDPPSRKLLDHARDLLVRHRPELQKLPRTGGLFGDFQPLQFTLTEWKAAQELNNELYEHVLAQWKRWHDLQRKFVELCEADILKTILRPLKGGALSELLPADFWRFEDYWLRFQSNRIDIDHPFEVRVDQPGDHWIFVTRESLRDATERIIFKNDSSSSAAHPDTPYKSEYMEVMDEVVIVLSITHHHQPKKVEVISAIQKVAPWLSPTNQNSMASFIRMKDSRKGRNKSA